MLSRLLHGIAFRFPFRLDVPFGGDTPAFTRSGWEEEAFGSEKTVSPPQSYSQTRRGTYRIPAGAQKSLLFRAVRRNRVRRGGVAGSCFFPPPDAVPFRGTASPRRPHDEFVRFRVFSDRRFGGNERGFGKDRPHLAPSARHPVERADDHNGEIPGFSDYERSFLGGAFVSCRFLVVRRSHEDRALSSSHSRRRVRDRRFHRRTGIVLQRPREKYGKGRGFDGDDVVDRFHRSSGLSGTDRRWGGSFSGPQRENRFYISESFRTVFSYRRRNLRRAGVLAGCKTVAFPPWLLAFRIHSFFPSYGYDMRRSRLRSSFSPHRPHPGGHGRGKGQAGGVAWLLCYLLRRFPLLTTWTSQSFHLWTPG